ncbi:Holliday junction resolvase RuvX [Sandaracinomonas limnophila]|uniref:Putative pre-16S rRNA nuclease n=1 Tax=Sandaracinomonas limnophila TaxID=1862386 RepID=A0A437PM10_9BACT|nr:Holliday junction resolvase RuvX [Sandaracinomonas limnophila]RVU23327.1 Holliday junction resolvase RuvX [Sandaracinomonas limnophila]
MGRILAIDYGLKRSGLAVTDPLKIIATALATVTTTELIKYLEDYFKKEEVEEVVIGMPKNLDNKDTDSTPFVRKFIKTFENKFPSRKITTIDERFTSKIAQQAMITGGMSKKNRQQKGNVDQIAATIILQEYLQNRTL